MHVALISPISSFDNTDHPELNEPLISSLAPASLLPTLYSNDSGAMMDGIVIKKNEIHLSELQVSTFVAYRQNNHDLFFHTINTNTTNQNERIYFPTVIIQTINTHLAKHLTQPLPPHQSYE
eukprot:4612953-Ditylum_brightwellii.AAC.1